MGLVRLLRRVLGRRVSRQCTQVGQGGSLLGKSQASSPTGDVGAQEGCGEGHSRRARRSPSTRRACVTRPKTQAKADALLEKEITITKRMIKNFPIDSPKPTEIVLRLAETYFELQQATNAKVRALDEPIFQAQQQKNKEKVKQLQDQQKQLERRTRSSARKPHQGLRDLVQDHPNFKRMDEVLFALGFSLDEMKQSEKAREVYYRLIKNFPERKFVPERLPVVRRALLRRRATCRLPPSSTARSPSSRRNGTRCTASRSTSRRGVVYNLEDFKGSLGKFVEVIEFGRVTPRGATSPT